MWKCGSATPATLFNQAFFSPPLAGMPPPCDASTSAITQVHSTAAQHRAQSWATSAAVKGQNMPAVPQALCGQQCQKRPHAANQGSCPCCAATPAARVSLKSDRCRRCWKAAAAAVAARLREQQQLWVLRGPKVVAHSLQCCTSGVARLRERPLCLLDGRSSSFGC